MKIIHKNETKIFKNNDVCTAIEYPLGDKDINGAIIELNGRYPDKGNVANEICKELAYVIKGSGKVVVEGKETKLNEGDLVLIEPGEKYFWQGDMTLFVPCTPAWYPEQHKEIGEQ
jgi:mannose-6-phosphate isomerase-like protein (cupin superfamily)